MRELAPIAEAAGVAVTTRLGEGDVDGRAALIRQLIANLVLNGIRHNVPTGGTVEVTTESDDDRVRLMVVNSGPVVPVGIIGTLTEPFVRGSGRASTGADRSGGEGSGLGLALVKRIAEAHGAALALEPRPAGGLMVRVTFPSPHARS